MATAPAPTPTPTVAPLHPGAASFTAESGSLDRRIGLLFAGTGIGLVLMMGVLGLVMRFAQATVIDVSPPWFYRVLTLHGAGMIAGVLVAMMGALWYVLRRSLPLRAGWMVAAYALTVGGAVTVLISTLIGGFGAGWTALPPLPFHPTGQWSTWGTATFLTGMLLAGSGFCVYCIDVLERATTRYGGLGHALGWSYLVGRERKAPPPEVIAATVIAICGLVSCAVGATILTGLIGQTYDAEVATDSLVAKNLMYFFGHSVANLGIYLGAAALYVVMPRYAGRPYAASRVFVAGWAGSLVFIITAYSHHLYMDFVQPEWAAIGSQIMSYGALLPVAVVTIYSMTMLVWGSRYRWTLASTLFYVGLAGWTIGGLGAVIDSIIPLNFRLHNTDWVVAHFHTYEILSVFIWGLAFMAHLLERDAGRTTSRAARIWTVTLILVGGYGLTGTWFVAGALGIPRRYAVQPAGTHGYSLVGAIFAAILATGILLVLIQFATLGRSAWSRRHEGRTAGRPRPAPAAPPAPLDPPGPPLVGRVQLSVAVAAAVVGLVAFLPGVIEASEASAHLHHLDHAGHFFVGAMVGIVAGSLPSVARRLGDRPAVGMALVLAAPAVMMLVMVPRFYEPLEAVAWQHAGYHLAMAAFGVLTGVGAAMLGRATGWVMLVLSVSMPLMFAAAMTTVGG